MGCICGSVSSKDSDSKPFAQESAMGQRQSQSPSTVEEHKPIKFSEVTSNLRYCIKSPETMATNLSLFYMAGEKYAQTLSDFSEWTNPSYVRLPSPQNWSTLNAQLTKLKEACVSGPLTTQPEALGGLMLEIISQYQPNAHNESDFGMFSNADLCKDVCEALPKIVDLALKLPELLSSPIPYLEQDCSRTLYFTKELCSSLLAHSFLCTIPERSQVRNIRDINFFRLFATAKTPDKASMKTEKIRCILHYFSRIVENPPPHIISFERRCISTQVVWEASSKPLTKVEVDLHGKIEDRGGFLQVDFANKDVGGGVLGNGSVMEEIRFSICPEMILSRLFTKTLTNNEVLVMKGTEQFSNYSGYASSFQFTGAADQSNLKQDVFGRLETEVVALDALSFKNNETDKQFMKENLDRELHKCFVGFFDKDCSAPSPVATGNWGCGAFNGDPEFKFLIQLMAASEAGRPSVWYHTIGDAEQRKSIELMMGFFESKGVTVGTLYNILTQFYGEHYHCDSVLDFVRHQWQVDNEKETRSENEAGSGDDDDDDEY